MRICGSSSTSKTSGLSSVIARLVPSRPSRPLARVASASLVERQREAERRAAPAALVDPDAAAVRAHDAAADRQPEAHAAALALAHAVELVEDALGVFRARRPARDRRPRPRPRPRARTRRDVDRACPAGEYFVAFSSRLMSTCSMRIASNGTSGKSAGIAVVHLAAAEPVLHAIERRADDLLERLQLLLHLQRARPRGASCRAGCARGDSGAAPLRAPSQELAAHRRRPWARRPRGARSWRR